MKKIFLFVISLFLFININSQVNQFDDNGKRHGIWIKKFKNGNIDIKVNLTMVKK